jgi:hypothetical protein
VTADGADVGGVAAAGREARSLMMCTGGFSPAAASTERRGRFATLPPTPSPFAPGSSDGFARLTPLGAGFLDRLSNVVKGLVR